MLQKLQSLSLSSKASLKVLLGYIFLVLAVLFVMRFILIDSFVDQAQRRLSANLNVGLVTLEKLGDGFSLRDGKLYVGDHLLNGDNTTIDFITKLVGGKWTLFMGDERVATNIIKENGERAVGTKLAQGPVYDKVLGEGKTYQGETVLFGKSFYVVYEPIKDATGKTVGIVFVGLDKAERLAVVPVLMKNIAIAAVLLGLFLSWLTYLSLRRQLKPIVTLAAVMERLQQDDVTVDVPARDHHDEIGEMAQAVQSFKLGIIEKHRLTAEQEAAQKQQIVRAQRMADLTKGFDASVSGVLEVVAGATTEMEATARSMTSTADNTKDQATVVAAATEESSASVQTVASAAEELSKSIEEIARQVKDSQSASQDASAEAAQTEEKMKRSAML